MHALPSNPWLRLPDSAPFVLDEDAELIAKFNARAKPQMQLDLTLLPEPFIGLPGAPVVLLGLNPGWSEDDAAAHADPSFAATLRKNLRHERSTYPFYFLDPARDSPGRRWWCRKLRPVIECVGERVAASGIFCIEFFPYHSNKYGSVPLLRSQEYSFALVRHAVQRGALIVSMRSWKRWTSAVPELAGYGRLFRLNNPMNVTVSPKNCPRGFEEIVSALAHKQCE